MSTCNHFIQLFPSTKWHAFFKNIILHSEGIGHGKSFFSIYVRVLGNVAHLRPTTILVIVDLVRLLRYSGGDGTWETAASALMLAFGGIYGMILYRVTRSYVRHRRYRRGVCGVCRYSLRSLPEPRCPECGTAFDPEWLDDRSVEAQGD